MKSLLEGLIPRLFPEMVVNQNFKCIPHQGKSDLDTSIPRKLKAWREPGVYFIIVRDNDCADKGKVAKKLSDLCEKSGRPDSIVSLVCQELESWYLGDLKSLSLAYPHSKIDTPAFHKKYSSPDDWGKPSRELERIIPEFQKGSGARLMGKYLDKSSNKSKSFHDFLSSFCALANKLGYK